MKHTAWLATRSGWGPEDKGPEWSGRLQMAGFAWEIGATRAGNGLLAIHMGTELPGRRRRRIFGEGRAKAIGPSRWSGVVEVQQSLFEVTLHRAVPSGVIDLPQDRSALPSFALLSISVGILTEEASLAPPKGWHGRDFLAVLNAMD